MPTTEASQATAFAWQFAAQTHIHPEYHGIQVLARSVTTPAVARDPAHGAIMSGEVSPPVAAPMTPVSQVSAARTIATSANRRRQPIPQAAMLHSLTPTIAPATTPSSAPSYGVPMAGQISRWRACP